MVEPSSSFVVTEPVRAARAHHVAHFGRPSQAFSYSAPAAGRLPGVEIGVFGSTPMPILVVTAGASAIPCRDGRRREWVLALKTPPTDAILQAVADLAALGLSPSTAVELDAFKPMWGAVAMDPRLLPEDARAFTLKDGTAVEMGWLVPVHAGEASSATKSLRGLWSLWQKRNVDLMDLRRPTAVAGAAPPPPRPEKAVKKPAPFKKPAPPKKKLR